MSTLSAGEVMRCHPCFDEQAHARVGRVHLPVAPRCNIRCAFCERRVCANVTQQHPGWAQQLLTPPEALARVQDLVRRHPQERFVVGVAGPGDPLANSATFEALAAVHAEFPHLLKCVSTNGLLLEEKLPDLLRVGICALTVTVNAPDGAVGERIYRWVRCGDTVYRGRAGAELLLERQLAGIRAALGRGLAVKVNTVLVPGINGPHIARLAALLRDAGVRLMNIMPLIPAGYLREERAPTCEELRQARAECESLIPQFRACEHCRADVVRFPRRGETGKRVKGE